MKVIFHKDVAGVGRRFDVKNVADGYALNFLIPKKLAVPATTHELARIEAEKAVEVKKKQALEAQLAKSLKKISAVTITLEEEANDKGHLFKGIHVNELVTALKAQADLEVGADFIVLEKPIKAVGDYKIEVKAGDKSATFILVVKGK